MKIQHFFGILLGCVLAASAGTAIMASAEDLAPEQVILATGTDTVNIIRPLLEKPTGDGFVTNADGSISYLNNGVPVTGKFGIKLDYVKGDCNGNGNLDASDAAVILDICASAAVEGTSADAILAGANESLTTDYQAELIADINDDHTIDSSDATDLLIYTAKQGAGAKLLPLGCGYFYADENGILQTGWIHDGEKSYFAKDDYTLDYGWNTVDEQLYYFTQDAVLVNTGLTVIEDKTYYFDQTAIFLTDTWVDIEGSMHYFGADGTMQTGLQTVNDKKYYLAADGALQTGGWLDCEDGKRLTTESGALILGWYEQDNGKMYFNEETGLLSTGFVPVGDRTFYFDEQGIMHCENGIIDGRLCKFREDGSYIDVKICLDAGHYGKYNHSPVNSAYWESDFTWKFHLLLKDSLEEYGIQVITTRPDQETDLALEARGNCSAGCDLFLSLHSNACNNTSTDGPLACVMIDGSTSELGQALADCVAEVMETSQGGSIWARRGEKYPNLDYYGVLRGAKQVGTPGILLEHSYHTNLRATYWLMNDENLQKMADAEAKLLAEYYDIS